MSPLAAVSDVAVVAPVPVFRMAAVTLPDDWSTAVTEDGKEYYFNLKTKQSQWAPPTGAQVEKATKKKKNQQNNLNEVIRFDSQPTVVIDRITINEPVPLPEGCGEADFRSNSLECGQPAKPLPIDVAEKTYGALSVVNNKEGSKSKAEAADARYRMLQDAEMKALSKTALFKKLDGQTQDPERKRLRAEEVRTITDQNDAGSRLAPWAREDDPYPPARIEYPKFEIPSWVPFIGSKEVKEAVEVAVDAEAVVAE